MNSNTDPTGLAAVVVGAVTPVIVLVALVLHWNTDVSGAVIAAVTGVVEGAVAVWAILQARRSAYAPATVAKISQESYDLGQRNAA